MIGRLEVDMKSLEGDSRSIVEEGKVNARHKKKVNDAKTGHTTRSLLLANGRITNNALMQSWQLGNSSLL